MRTIFITGLCGSDKKSIGSIVAKKLQLPLLDMLKIHLLITYGLLQEGVTPDNNNRIIEDCLNALELKVEKEFEGQLAYYCNNEKIDLLDTATLLPFTMEWYNNDLFRGKADEIIGLMCGKENLVVTALGVEMITRFSPEKFFFLTCDNHSMALHRLVQSGEEYDEETVNKLERDIERADFLELYIPDIMLKYYPNVIEINITNMMPEEVADQILSML